MYDETIILMISSFVNFRRVLPIRHRQDQKQRLRSDNYQTVDKVQGHPNFWIHDRGYDFGWNHDGKVQRLRLQQLQRLPYIRN